VPAQRTAQPSRRRLHELGIRPNRDLGQNFLVDSNILSVIGAAAELAAHDVVLEIGGGLGVLSEYLAERVGHVHVVELDRRLQKALGEAAEPFANVSLHWADAMKIDLRALSPQPQKLVANLPYGIATAALVRTIDELPQLACWVVMVQREVGERLAAAPGGRVYGASSVIVQLACEVEVLRTIPRTVFYPVPHIDSVLVRLRRRDGRGSGIAEPRTALSIEPDVLALVHGAFAHRRKTLAGSLALAAAAEDDPPHLPLARERIREALTEIGHPPDVRAERLSPQDFVALARMLAR
jgi:16S rRNA (adenine1518-N6/adenine1519-N6)-dimethyltransferase